MSRLVIFALALLFAMLVQSFGGKIEGAIWPVVRVAEITRAEAVSETRTRFWGASERLRRCSLERFEWRLGTPDASAPADLEFEDGAAVRVVGPFTFGPWVVQLTPDQLFRRSFATAYHRCHIFWLTETRFYG
jgi:hypothetical protein